MKLPIQLRVVFTVILTVFVVISVVTAQASTSTTRVTPTSTTPASITSAGNTKTQQSISNNKNASEEGSTGTKSGEGDTTVMTTTTKPSGSWAIEANWILTTLCGIIVIPQISSRINIWQ